MLFEVFRTSSPYIFDEDYKPCEEATLHEYVETITERVDITKSRRPLIQQRQRTLKCWVVEINTLEELLEFRKRHNEDLVITSGADGLIGIEIYDDWRE